jgi:hypothetical protein
MAFNFSGLGGHTSASRAQHKAKQMEEVIIV